YGWPVILWFPSSDDRSARDFTPRLEALGLKAGRSNRSRNELDEPFGRSRRFAARTDPGGLCCPLSHRGSHITSFSYYARVGHWRESVRPGLSRPTINRAHPCPRLKKPPEENNDREATFAGALKIHLPDAG